MEEIWKDIDENYEVSNMGKVRNKKKKIELKLTPHVTQASRPYYVIHLYDKQYQVSRLVAERFVDNPDKDKYKFVIHINGDRLDNRAENLRWTECRQDGIANAHKLGLINHRKKDKE